jgi:hypothetical protein
MKQKYILKSAVSVAFAGAALFATSSAFAAAPIGPMDSIADSWHNLGTNNVQTNGTPNGTTPANHSTATGEICVFCHTPHGGDTGAAVPIWNRKLNDPAAYQRYSDLNSTTFDAEEGPIGSVTIACLSCHDGAQAIDALINAPGSGGYTDPTTPFGDAAYRAWTGGNDMTGGDIVNNALAPNIVQNLGTDLRNDHPVSMQYGGGGILGDAAGNATGTTRDPDFTQLGTVRTIQDANGANVDMQVQATQHATLGTVFWIERSDSLNAGNRDREDIIFYTRDFASPVNGDAGIQPFVECGSCHDPHNVDNPTFLRTSNGLAAGTALATAFPNAVDDAASGLCLTCHDK